MWEYLIHIQDMLLKFFGLLFIIYLILKALTKIFKEVDLFVTTIRLKVYYPIAFRITKRKHKQFVNEYLKKLLETAKMKNRPPSGLAYDVRLEWSDEEEVILDLDKGLLLVRAPYTPKIYELLAKILITVSPYAVSTHLEPIFGKKLAQILSLCISRDLASWDVNVLREFSHYVNEIYAEDKELSGLIKQIEVADDSSLYRHIVLYELKRVLEVYGGRLSDSKDMLLSDITELIKIVGSLDSIERPMLCGHYIKLAIVRAGTLDKIILEQWQRYVMFIKACLRQCRNLERIYIISAGRTIISRVAENLVNYILQHVEGTKLTDSFQYEARYYRGKPKIPQYVAVIEVQN